LAEHKLLRSSAVKVLLGGLTFVTRNPSFTKIVCSFRSWPSKGSLFPKKLKQFRKRRGEGGAEGMRGGKGEGRRVEIGRGGVTGDGIPWNN